MLKRTLLALTMAVWPVVSQAAELERPTIEIAICLDTSGSMDGLIESAKQKLWAVVTDMGTAKPSPALKVALYQYGNDGLQSENGWVQELCPLTDDLDSVYEKLFALKTNGGTELVARVVKTSAESLSWSNDSSTLRMIVVAGNEPATQDGKVTLESACSTAAGKGIVVNSIFCGPEAEGRSTGWADVARLADGRFSAIDQDGGTVVIATPFDEEIATLGTRLNTTYMAYGAAGAEGLARQTAQDRNAMAVSAPAAAERAVGKAQAQYSNSRWDLVDAVTKDELKLAELEVAALPEEMREMDNVQRQQFIDAKAAERKEIQDRINVLNTQRAEFQKAEQAKRGQEAKTGFDAALRSAIREQASAKGIQFEQ